MVPNPFVLSQVKWCGGECHRPILADSPPGKVTHSRLHVRSWLAPHLESPVADL